MLEGFGKHKSEAIRLLKTTIDILDSYGITHMLISGTLLGYVRNNDFIPWDDDIDILVDETIYDLLPDIDKSHPEINIFWIKNEKYNCIKFCFSDGLEITNDNVSKWRKNGLSSDRYCWPFIDLFVYEMGPGLHCCSVEYKDDLLGDNPIKIFNPLSGDCREPYRFFSDSEISFFHNDWDKKQFFPLKKVDFLGLQCNIPNNPNYFLSMNYGSDYMTNIKLPNIIHKI